MPPTRCRAISRPCTAGRPRRGRRGPGSTRWCSTTRSPVDTPSGLAVGPRGRPDPAMVNLARAVQVLDAAGLAVDVPLGDVQFAERHGKKIPVHGGNFWDGTTNVVGRGGRLNASILD